MNKTAENSDERMEEKFNDMKNRVKKSHERME
jgi:hypothetical protein